MKKLWLALFISWFALGINAQKPKLVVGIVIDQMRQDYLLRFEKNFTEGGFKRLMNDGFYFRNAHYNYIPTYTAPGHASIYTGTTPSNHGIISNSWFDKRNGLNMYCVSDTSVNAVGGSKRNGQMSPRNLKASTITDQLRLASNFKSKVIGISIKDRGSILPAGHNPTAAYWFDSSTGKFMTSTYYMNELPDWVTQFNRKRLVNQYLGNTWETSLPIDQYVNSTPDEVPYERKFKGKSSFPYELATLAQSYGLGLIRTTPFGNTVVLDMAIAAMEGEKLGTDEYTDFLAVSLSSTDYIGHAFGPNSIEIQDTYIKLDMEMNRLLNYLDQKFGSDYLVFVSSDHGVVEVPSFLRDNKLVGGYVNINHVDSLINEKLKSKFGKGEWVRNLSNDQIFLNHQLIESEKLELKMVRNYLKKILLEVEGISRVYTIEELTNGHASDFVKKRFENGYNMKMSGDIAISLIPGYLFNDGKDISGTTHGSGHTYDTHVPMLFFGSGIRKGSSVRQVSITDIAPSLSMLLGISLPSACTGQPLIELFE